MRRFPGRDLAKRFRTEVRREVPLVWIGKRLWTRKFWTAFRRFRIRGDFFALLLFLPGRAAGNYVVSRYSPEAAGTTLVFGLLTTWLIAGFLIRAKLKSCDTLRPFVALPMADSVLFDFRWREILSGSVAMAAFLTGFHHGWTNLNGVLGFGAAIVFGLWSTAAAIAAASCVAALAGRWSVYLLYASGGAFGAVLFGSSLLQGALETVQPVLSFLPPQWDFAAHRSFAVGHYGQMILWLVWVAALIKVGSVARIRMGARFVITEPNLVVEKAVAPKEVETSATAVEAEVETCPVEVIEPAFAMQLPEGRLWERRGIVERLVAWRMTPRQRVVADFVFGEKARLSRSLYIAGGFALAGLVAGRVVPNTVFEWMFLLAALWYAFGGSHHFLCNRAVIIGAQAIPLLVNYPVTARELLQLMARVQTVRFSISTPAAVLCAFLALRDLPGFSPFHILKGFLIIVAFQPLLSIGVLMPLYSGQQTSLGCVMVVLALTLVGAAALGILGNAVSSTIGILMVLVISVTVMRFVQRRYDANQRDIASPYQPA